MIESQASQETLTELRLVAFDMEGTLTADPTVWEVMHRKLGTWESHGLKYWQRYLAGDIAYDDFAQLDVAAWKGAPEALLEESVLEVGMLPGCAELLASLHARGIRTVVISNGLLRMASRLVREHGMAGALANHARAEGGVLTGEVDILVPYEQKADALRQMMERLGVGPQETAAVGDSRADGAMFRLARLGIAFRPSDPDVARLADRVVETDNLRDVGRILLPDL